jgi:subtilisin
VLGAVGHWSLLRRRVDPSRPLRLAVHPFDHRVADGRGHRIGTPRLTAGHGVRVALVDTGVARDHPDLVVAGGRNCATGEDPDDYGPNGHEHGTHVAGIVAGRGRAPTGRRGVAPGAEVYSYRAFAKGEGEATSFAIAKALDAAVRDGCDVVNLSLGGGGADPIVRAAIEEAQESGLVVVAAAGNDGRLPVAFPADLPDVVAVSALGRTGTLPRSAGGAAERRGPYGRDGADFIAAFSNIGAIDVTAPGVGIVSTVPGGYLDLDGTSMACPFVTGILARILTSSRRLRGRPRGPERAAALLAALHRRARSLGFPSSLEGDGLAR